MDPIKKLTELFTNFPGIGPRQARRFTYYLLTRDQAFLAELAQGILQLQKNSARCSACFRFFPLTAGQQESLCSICSNQNRERALLMIVEKDVDLENLEKSKVYNGLYIVLGGIVPILEKEPEKKIRVRDLIERINSEKENLKEVILGLNATPEGEHTADYILSILQPLQEKYSFKISMLGRGLSTGTELEYSDTETIKNALRGRI